MEGNLMIRNQIEAFQQKLLSLKLSAKQTAVKVTKFQSSAHPFANKSHSYSNIFDVGISVAGDTKTWQVVFNPDEFLSPPDIIFGNDDDSFCPDLKTLKSIANWDAANPASLNRLIEDLYHLYLSHQRKIVLDYGQVKKEFEEFINSCDASTEIDIKNNGPGTFNDTIKITVPLNADYCRLPPSFKMEHSGDTGCCISITYESPNLSSKLAQLELSPDLKRVLGGSANLSLPAIGSSTLKEYVEKVQDLLENTVNTVADLYEKRKSLIMTLLSEFHGHVLEYNQETFAEAVFLISQGGFQFLLFILLTEQYPMEQPQIYLQSIYPGNTSGITRKPLKKLNYKPYGSDFQTVINIKNCIQSNFESFKNQWLHDR